jgi:peptidoglycan L-alanyl-D-glutamate endopeptidase CwlK
MASYGNASRGRLESAHPDLRRWAERLILRFDHTVVCAHRGEEDQEEAFRNGKSKVHYPDSRHNVYPSLALDLAPWDAYRGVIDWDHPKRFILLAGMGLELAQSMELPITWGGDWDCDTFMRDHDFKDYPHYQLPKDWDSH